MLTVTRGQRRRPSKARDHRHARFERAAIGRVAACLADGLAVGDVCSRVADEVAALYALDAVCIVRIDTSQRGTVMSTAGSEPGALDCVGASVPLTGDSVLARVSVTGRAVQLAPYPEGDDARLAYLRTRFSEGAGVPIVVQSVLWGVLAVGRGASGNVLPKDIIEALESFAALIGAAAQAAETRPPHARDAFLDALFASAPVGCMFVDLNLRVARANATSITYQGGSEDVVVGQHVDRFYPPTVVQAFQHACEANTPVAFTILRGGVPGRDRTVRVDVAPVRGIDGSAIGLSVVTRDVTSHQELGVQRRRITEAERESRGHTEVAVRDLLAGNEAIRDTRRQLAHQTELLRTLTALEPDGIFAVDRDGCFTFLNDAAATRLGTGIDEAIGRVIEDILPVDLATTVRAEARVALATGIPSVVEREVVLLGERVTLLLMLAPYKAGGDTLGIAGIARELTNHDHGDRVKEVLLTRERAAQRVAQDSIRRLEEQNDRLRELDHSKDEILALISHDLRTPLTSILGYAELLLNEIPSDELRHRRFVDVIARNSERLVGLLDDLLLMAQHRAGGLTVTPEYLDIGPLVKQCAEAAIPMAKKKGILVTQDVDDHLTTDVDARRFGQLLDNLVQNAIKYTQPDGFIDVSAKREGAQIALRVRDNGPGIGYEEQRRIFDRFTRARDAAQGGTRGFGLGLTIAHAIVDAHGGRIGVDSTPGTGSTFWVVLPLIRENEAGDPALHVRSDTGWA